MTAPQKPDPARRQLFARSLLLSMAMVSAVGIIGYYGARGDLPFFSDPTVSVAIDAPDSVTIRAGAATSFNVTATITNGTDAEVSLAVENPCNTVRWIILAGGDAFVQAKEDADCLGRANRNVLAPGEKLQTSFTVTLDLRRSLYQPEGKYQLLVEYWGIQADDGRPHQFELVQ